MGNDDYTCRVCGRDLAWPQPVAPSCPPECPLLDRGAIALVGGPSLKKLRWNSLPYEAGNQHLVTNGEKFPQFSRANANK